MTLNVFASLSKKFVMRRTLHRDNRPRIPKGMKIVGGSISVTRLDAPQDPTAEIVIGGGISFQYEIGPK